LNVFSKLLSKVGAFVRALPKRAWVWLGALVRMRETNGSAYGLITLFTVPYIWLIWRYRYLPMQDLPGHIELSFLYHRLSLDDPAYTQFYQVAPQPWPNSLSTLVLSGFGSVFGFETGVKVLLSVYAVAWPLSLALLATLLGRTPLLGLFVIPTILDFSWSFGFFNYLLAKPLVVAAVCTAITFSRRPTLKRAAILVLMIGLTFLAHALAFGVAGIWAGVAVLCFSHGSKRVLNLWPLVLSIALPVRYVIAQQDAGPVQGGWWFGNWDMMLNSMWHHVGSMTSTNYDEKAYLLGFVAWLLAAAAQPMHGTIVDPRRLASGSFFLWLSVILLFVGYAVGPINMPNVDILAQRLLVFAYALVMISPLYFPRDYRRYVIALIMTMAVGAHIYAMSDQYKSFNRIEMKGFSELIAMIPPGKTLATHYNRASSPYGNHNAMWHWPKLYGVRQGGGGHSDDTFAWRATSYVNLTQAGLTNSTFRRAGGFQRLTAFDYYLCHGGPPDAAIAQAEAGADYIASRSEWHLFQVKKP
jgi:hypothetical protein